MSPKYIILVENDVNLRQSIALILQRAGYLVSATSLVDKALELLKSKNYHMLISDINIPETTNVLLPRVLDVYPHLPVVILTDQSRAEADRVSEQYNALYLVKPVAPERLLDFVKSTLNNRKSNHYNHNGFHVEQS